MSLSRNDWLEQANLRLKQSGNTNTPRLDAEIILAHTLKLERITLHAHPETRLSLSEINTLNKLVVKRTTGYPIAYLTGHKEFFGYNFAVSKHTLIPRPETEEIVLAAIGIAVSASQSVVHIADVGCGSGAIGLSLALELEKLKQSYEITLTDISTEALRICRNNQLSLGALNTTIIQNNLLDNVANRYNVIVANLPYVSQEWKVGLETKFEPQNALFAPNDGLALIKKLIRQVADQRNLQKGGWLVLESDPCQQEAIASQLRMNNFENITYSSYTTIAQYRQ